MKSRLGWINRRRSLYVLGGGLVAGLFLFKLGSLVSGFSGSEIAALKEPLGWHGIYHQPFDLALKILRSIDLKLSPNPTHFLGRLPNALLGIGSAVAFFGLVRFWHNRRIALMCSILFVSSAWVLHVGQLASSDVLYLLAGVMLPLMFVALNKRPTNFLVFYGSLVVFVFGLYVPGLIWLLLLTATMSWKGLKTGWEHFKGLKGRSLSILLIIAGWPLLIYNLRFKANLLTWIGLPLKWDTPKLIGKHFLAVFVHLFIRGPKLPELWLARAPLFSVFVLAAFALGASFYLRRFKLSRSRFLILFFGLGYVLIGLGGAVSLSLLVPSVILVSGTGIAYLLHSWYKVFPSNPLARSVGLGLICLAVAVSAVYGLKAYFIAWPHNQQTMDTFRYSSLR